MTRAESLRHPSLSERVSALEQILTTPSEVTADEIAAAIEALADQRKAVQRQAAQVLAQCARTTPALIEQLGTMATTGSSIQRWGAVFALSLVGPLPRRVLPTLLEALDRDDGDVRWAATELIKQLARHEPVEVSAALLRAARDGTANGRKMALYCLRDLAVTDAAAVAAAALTDEVIDVRLAALAALVALSPDKEVAAKQVLTLMNDADMRLRRAAAVALGQLGVASDAVRAALQRAVAEGDPSLRRAAEYGLRLLGSTGPSAVADRGSRGGDAPA